MLVRDGEIAEIGDGLTAPEGAEVVDAAGKHLFPGFVDPHVHLRTPGFEYKENIETGTRSAAAGGFTAIIAMANTNPPVDSPGALQFAAHARRRGGAHSGWLQRDGHEGHGRASSCRRWRSSPTPAPICFTDDGLPIADAGLMRQALQYQRLAGRADRSAPGRSAACARRRDARRRGAARLGLTGIRRSSESTMIARDALLAEYEDGRIHVQHLSSVGSIEADRCGQGSAASDHDGSHAAPPDADRRSDRRRHRRELQDEPAAAHGGRSACPDRGPARVG